MANKEEQERPARGARRESQNWKFSVESHVNSDYQIIRKEVGIWLT